MIKEERRRKRRNQKILIAVTIFLFVILLSILIIWKVFVVKKVNVEGNVLYDEQLITDTVLNDEYSWNSLYVLLKYTITEAEELPFIEEMEVKMVNPQTLSIKVYEKRMMGYLNVSPNAGNAYFDKDGFVVEISSRVIEDIPRIDGLACDEVIQYEKLPLDEQLLKQLLTLTQSLRREELEPDSINYSVANEPILYYGNVAIRLGTMDNLTLKVEHLSKILPSLDGISGVLHMENWTEESANIIFEKTVVEEETQGTGEDTEVSEEESGTTAETNE